MDNFDPSETTAPQIHGTIVNRGVNQKYFDRKLKMIPASLFTLLSVCHFKDFFKENKYANSIKEGIIIN